MSLAESSRSARTLRERLKRIGTHQWVIGGALTIYTALSAAILIDAGVVPRPRIDLSPILSAGAAIQVHVVAALLTLSIGIFLMFAPKGFRLHRTFGWMWVASMAVTAGSSFFITAIFQTHYSPIHALSAWTMLGLPFGIAAVKRRDIRKHRTTMTNMFVGGMLVAGLFSMLPGRMMWHVFFAV
ncbi:MULTISPECIES: DUF2306 domain-containing protein [Henriciella]|jgi:uncharacterized membrane protein|uniref:DUF2306 domain-containing protein n=1 Tax=Henriciella TaxID=453849 RepID=UPI003511E929